MSWYILKDSTTIQSPNIPCFGFSVLSGIYTGTTENEQEVLIRTHVPTPRYLTRPYKLLSRPLQVVHIQRSYSVVPSLIFIPSKCKFHVLWIPDMMLLYTRSCIRLSSNRHISTTNKNYILKRQMHPIVQNVVLSRPPSLASLPTHARSLIRPDIQASSVDSQPKNGSSSSWNTSWWFATRFIRRRWIWI